MEGMFIENVGEKLIKYDNCERINDYDSCSIVRYIDISGNERYAVLHKKSGEMLFRSSKDLNLYNEFDTPLTKAYEEHLYCDSHLRHELGTRRFCTMGEYIVNADEIVEVPYMILFSHDKTFQKTVIDGKFIKLFNNIRPEYKEKYIKKIIHYKSKSYRYYELPFLEIWTLYGFLESLNNNGGELSKEYNLAQYSNVENNPKKLIYDEDSIYKGIGRTYYDIHERNSFFDSVYWHKAFGIFKFYPPISVPFLVKNIGSSQFTDGVRIDKEFHDVFNPPNTYFYANRGSNRKIKILFNGKIFEAKYVFEGQSDENIELQSIRFKKTLKDEFTKVFPNQVGMFIIQQGVDVNHFTFSPVEEIHDEKELDSGDNYKEFVQSLNDIVFLERKYRDAIPQVQEKISKRIERGSIAASFKKLNGYKCSLCQALGDNPYSFKKKNGEYYIEVHHIIPVSQLEKGSLSYANLITVCPNHHRQLHYGDIKVEIQCDMFIFTIDNKKIAVTKVRI